MYFVLKRPSDSVAGEEVGRVLVHAVTTLHSTSGDFRRKLHRHTRLPYGS